jgi:hypothetical protein
LRSYVAFSLPSRLFLYRYSLRRRAFLRIMLCYAAWQLPQLAATLSSSC